MLKGTKATPETRQKQSIAKLGKKRTPFSENTIRKMSEIAKNRYLSPERIAKQKQTLREKYSKGLITPWNKKYLTLEQARKAKSGSATNRRLKLHKLVQQGLTHTLGEWELLKKQYGYICPGCKKSEPDILLTRDHIIPLSKGGTDCIENIQPLCQSCNSHKHTKITRF